jgi:hypothetical protein
VVVQPKTIVDMVDVDRVPAEVRLQLLSYLCPGNVFKLRYDLDKGTTEKRGFPVFEICKTLRRCTRIEMWVKVSVSYPFRGLEEWAWSVSDYLEETKSFCQYITLTLRLPKIESNGNTAFDLPAARIFRATKNLHPYTQFKVVAADEDEDEAYMGPLVELTTIGKKLLILVYYLLKLSPDPLNQPIPRIWIDKDLRFSHAEIEYEDGQFEHVPYFGDYTSDEVHDKAYHLMQFFLGHYDSNTGDDDGCCARAGRICSRHHLCRRHSHHTGGRACGILLICVSLTVIEVYVNDGGIQAVAIACGQNKRFG